MLRHGPAKQLLTLARLRSSEEELKKVRASFRRRAYTRVALLATCVFLVCSVLIDLLAGGSSYPHDIDSLRQQTSEILEESNGQLEVVSNVRNASIGKVTMIYGNFMPVFERALALQELHNERWGYSMFTLRTQILEQYWSKPAYILKLLLEELEKPEDTRLKWLMWIDADVVLMNQEIPLEIFLPGDEWDDIHCLVTNDFHGLNNGVFFLRVHEWSVWLISAVLSTKVWQPKVKLRWGDQTALERQLATEQFIHQTRHVPQRWFNAFAGDRGKPDPDPWTAPTRFRPSSVKEGDLLVHFPAHYDARARRMNTWLDVAEKHAAPWEVPLDNTTYMEEIAQYWEKEAGQEVEFLRSRKKVFDKVKENNRLAAEAKSLEELRKVKGEVLDDLDKWA